MIINKKWREYYEEVLKNGDILEQIANGLPFDAEIVGYSKILICTLKKATIQQFAAKVKEISAIYGPPTRIRESPVSEDHAPDLSAEWKPEFNNFKYTVELISKEPDCPYDPLSEYEPSYYRSGKSRRLHAICRNVLKELEDIDESAIKDA